MMILSFLACTSGGDFSEFIPTVKFNRLDLTDLSFDDLSIDFVFDVRNPNPVDLPLERFDYALDLADIEILWGDSPTGIELRGEDTSEMVLPVTLSFEGIYELVTTDRGVDNLPFAFRGGFGWDTDIGPVDVTFDEQGDFPALRIPDFKVAQMNVGEVTAESAGFSLDLDIDNDHASTLDFTNMDFKVKFAGVQVATGKEETFGSVEGATTRRLNLPFSVDYLDAIEAIAAAASGQKLKVDLQANTDVLTPFGPDLVPLSIDENGDVKVAE